eukprot:3941066-Rhodomonas_salina.1
MSTAAPQISTTSRDCLPRRRYCLPLPPIVSAALPTAIAYGVGDSGESRTWSVPQRCWRS